MSEQRLLAELARLDVKVKANGGKLSYNAPKGTMTPKLLAQLKEHKAEILERLAPQAPKEDHATREITKPPRYSTNKRQFLEPCHHGTPGGCWLCKKYNLKPPIEKTVEEVLKDPPYWIRDAYLPGYQRGNISLEVLAGAVAAELGHSHYEAGNSLVQEVKAALPTLFSEKEDKIERMVWI